MGSGAAGLGRRPLLQVDESSLLPAVDFGDLDCVRLDGGGGAGAFKPMSRLVTLLAVADIGLPTSDRGGISSIGEAAGRSPDELFFPKPNFHLDVFFTTTGGALMTGTGGISGDSRG